MTGEALRISPANDPRGSPAKEQQAVGVGIILQIMMLVLSFVLGHVLRRHKFYYLPEANASLLIEVSSSTIHQQLAYMLSWQTMQRPPILAGSSGPPATSVQTTSAPAAIPITSPAASQHTTVPHASALFPGIPSRPPHVSSRVSPMINHQVSRGIRAPAPHLQPFRPSTSLASTSLPSSVLPTLPSNARPTSIPLLQPPLLSPLATCNTSLYNRAPGPETSGVVPSVPNPSLSAMDLLMDFVDNRSGASQILPSGLPSVSEFSSSSVPII